MDINRISVVSGTALLALGGTASAGPMSVTSSQVMTPPIPIEQVRYYYRHHYRHYGWYRHPRYYGWNPAAPVVGGAVGLATLPVAAQPYLGYPFFSVYPYYSGYSSYGYGYPYGYGLAAAATAPVAAAAGSTAPLVTGRSVATGPGYGYQVYCANGYDYPHGCPFVEQPAAIAPSMTGLHPCTATNTGFFCK